MDEGWTAATRMLATHLVSIAGVVVASQRSLATYLAVASLSHPVFPTSNESTTREPTASRVRTLIANPRVRKTLAVIASITMIVAIYALAVGAFVALFRLASQVVLDAAMVAIFGSFVTFTLIETISVCVDVPVLVAYKPRFPKASEKDKQKTFFVHRTPAPDGSQQWYRRPFPIATTAIAMSVMVLGLTAAGFKFGLVLIPVTWIVPVVSGFHTPTMSMRRVTQILWGYIALLLTVVAIMIPIAMHYQAKHNAKSPEELAQEAQDTAAAPKWTQPSDWISHFLNMFQYLYIIGAPGVFIAMNWRFDYTFQHSAYLGARPTSNGQQDTALVPAMTSLPSFQPRTAFYAIGALVSCVIGLTGTFIVNQDLGAFLSSTAGLVAVVPIMTLATAFGAWRQGIVREWWAYSETWTPTADDALQADERGLNEMPVGATDSKEHQ